MEPEPVADAIRRWMPTGLMAHIQFNDRNKRGPGQGDDKFAPVIRALRETGYDGWIAMEPFVYEPDGADLRGAHDRLRPRSSGAGMKVKLEEVERYERPMTMRLAFRFGVITVTGGIQAVIRVRISLPDGRSGEGVAAEALAAKWFEKSPEFTDDQNLDQLRQSLDLAIEHYKAHGADTPFGLFAGTYSEQQKKGAALRLNPLVASYGPALLDRAILDALGKITGNSFAQMIVSNLPGIRTTELTPDIEQIPLARFLAALKPASSIELRHTVGLVDPLTAGDRTPMERINDGLPETLEEVVSYYRGRYYKLKVAGDIKADLDRLTPHRLRARHRLPATIDARFDGNEQYDDVEGIVELWRKVDETPALARMVAVDAVHRAADQAQRGAQPARSSALAKLRPVIIDESDGELSSFPTALKLGYSGVSSKNCKGFYKSILNASRVARLGPGHFMSAEDLTTLPGVSVQQDLALVSLLGMTHVERNAHHFVDGMSFALGGRAEGLRAGAPRPLRRKDGQPARLKAPGGKIALGSLGCRASRSAPSSISTRMRPMPRRRPRERLNPACRMSDALARSASRRVAALEDFMTTPSPGLVADLAKTPGDILVLGVGGKMGPTLARMAKRAAPGKRVIGVARFSEPGAARGAGAGRRRDDRRPTCSTAPRSRALPKAANVVFMAGRKFGATGDVPLTWAMNVQVPAMVAEVFKASRIVAFSTGCVYPVRAGRERRRDRGRAAGAAARRLRQLLRRPRAHVRVFLGAARHAGPAVPAQLRDRHALRRAARHRPQGARRRDDRSRHGPCQRDLAGRRQRGGAALPRARHDADHADQCHRPGDVRGALARRRVRQAAGQDADLHAASPRRPAGSTMPARMVKEFGPPSVPLADDDRMDGRLAVARHGHAQQADALRGARWQVLTSCRSRRSIAAESEAVWPLSIEAGWNQNVADWRFMLGAGRGFGLRNAPANGRRARSSCRSASGSPGSAWCW